MGVVTDQWSGLVFRGKLTGVRDVLKADETPVDGLAELVCTGRGDREVSLRFWKTDELGDPSRVAVRLANGDLRVGAPLVAPVKTSTRGNSTYVELFALDACADVE